MSREGVLQPPTAEGFDTSTCSDAGLEFQAFAALVEPQNRARLSQRSQRIADLLGIKGLACVG